MDAGTQIDDLECIAIASYRNEFVEITIVTFGS